MLINATNLNTLYAGFKGAFNKGFESVPSAYKEIAMVVPSATMEEEYGWLGQFPKLREWLGDRVVWNLAAHAYKIKNRDFELTISVGRNNIEDDQYGIYGPMFTEIGKSAAEKPDELIFGLLAGGFTGICYDGQHFFDTDHPVMNETGEPASVSNIQDGAAEPWFLLDTTRAVKPFVYQERRALGNLLRKDNPNDDNVFWNKEFVYGTDGRANAGFGLWQLAYASKAALTAENYEAARAAMMNQKGDAGRPLNIKPNVLVCGPNLEGAAMRLLNNGTRIVTVENGDDTTTQVSVQNEWAGTAKPIVTQWLTAA